MSSLSLDFTSLFKSNTLCSDTSFDLSINDPKSIMESHPNQVACVGGNLDSSVWIKSTLRDLNLDIENEDISPVLSRCLQGLLTEVVD